jgi:hypothetical protein
MVYSAYTASALFDFRQSDLRVLGCAGFARWCLVPVKRTHFEGR